MLFNSWGIFIFFLFPTWWFTSFQSFFLWLPLLSSLSHSIKSLLDLFGCKMRKISLNFRTIEIWSKCALFHTWFFTLSTNTQRLFLTLQLTMKVIKLNWLFLTNTSLTWWKLWSYHSLWKRQSCWLKGTTIKLFLLILFFFILHFDFFGFTIQNQEVSRRDDSIFRNIEIYLRIQF